MAHEFFKPKPSLEGDVPPSEIDALRYAVNHYPEKFLYTVESLFRERGEIEVATAQKIEDKQQRNEAVKKAEKWNRAGRLVERAGEIAHRLEGSDG